MIKVPAGFSLFSPTFKGVSTKLDLSAIDICNADGSINLDVYGGVQIQLMNEGGKYQDIYSYDKDSNPTTGWSGPEGDIEVGDITFNPGEAFCVNNQYTDGDLYFRVSGEVDLINKNKIGLGFVLWGNATPVAFDLSELNIVDESGDINYDIYGGVQLQLMNEAGKYQEIYSYDKDSNPTTGWSGPNGDIEVGEVVLKPGEAVCINNAYDSADAVWMNPPCPIKK